jgi:hypothetical protein
MHDSTCSATNVRAISIIEHKYWNAQFGFQIQFKPHSILCRFNFQAIQFNFDGHIFYTYIYKNTL